MSFCPNIHKYFHMNFSVNFKVQRDFLLNAVRESSTVIFFLPLLMVKKATPDVGVLGRRRRIEIFRSVQFGPINFKHVVF